MGAGNKSISILPVAFTPLLVLLTYGVFYYSSIHSRALVASVCLLASSLYLLKLPNQNKQLIAGKPVQLLLMVSVSCVLASFVALSNSWSIGLGLQQLAIDSMFYSFAAVALVYFSDSIPITLDKKTLLFAKIVLVGIVINALWGMQQFLALGFDSNFKWYGEVPYGMNYNPNLFASYSAYGLPFAAIFYGTGNKAEKLLATIVSVFLIMTIVLSQTRSAWISVLVFVAFVCLYVTTGKSGKSKPNRLWLVAAFAIPIITMAFYSDFGAIIWNRFEEAIAGINSAEIHDGNSVHERLVFWRMSWDLFIESPLRGVGLGNFFLVIFKGGAEGILAEKGNLFASNPHNDLFYHLVEKGVIAALLYLIFIGGTIYFLFRTYLKTKGLTELMMTCLLTIFFLDSMLSFPKYRIEHLVVIGIAFGISWNWLNLNPNYHYRFKLLNIPFRAIVISLIGFAALQTVWWSAATLEHAQLEKAVVMKMEGAEDYQLIEQYNQVDLGIMPFRFGSARPVAIEKGWLLMKLGRIEEGIALIESTIHLIQYSPASLAAVGFTYFQYNRFDLAAQYLEQSISIAPKYDFAKIALARLRYKQGNLEQAFQLLSEAKLTNELDIKFKQLVAYQLRQAKK